MVSRPGVWLAVLALATGCAAPERSPRNAVVILVDTLRADRTSLYGYQRPTTPALDRWAERGVVFERAWSQAGCTYPSVNSLLTSRYPQEFFDTPKALGRMAIPPETPSIAELLGAEGWSTAAVSASWIVRATPSKTNRDGGFGRGFDRFDESCFTRPASCLNRRVGELLETLEEPFFLYLHYVEPHAPYRPPRWHERRFATAGSRHGWLRRGNIRPLMRWVFEGQPLDFDDTDLAYLHDLYDEEVLFFDGALDRLMTDLEARGRLEDTVVVLASDHGEELFEHDQVAHCRDQAWENILATFDLARGEAVLYDLTADPGETTDVSELEAEVFERHVEWLGGWIERLESGGHDAADKAREIEEMLRALGYL